jgi:hypothetical protein
MMSPSYADIHLTAIDLMLAAYHAGLIEGVKAVQVKNRQVSNRRISNQSDFGIHYIGMLGEIAVAKTIGTTVSAEITVGGDGGNDMELHGQTIQVKTSSHANTPPPRYLIFNNFEDFATDWAISCSIQSPTVVRIHGFVGRGKFRGLANQHNFGYGIRICLDEKHLSPISRFMEAVNWKRGNEQQAISG